MPGSDDDDEIEDELLALGADPEAVEAAREKATSINGGEDGDITVWTENWNIVEVFTRCRFRTQVVASPVGGMVVYEGIDAAEIRNVVEMLDLPRAAWRELLWGVRVMEAAALPALNRRG